MVYMNVVNGLKGLLSAELLKMGLFLLMYCSSYGVSGTQRLQRIPITPSSSMTVAKLPINSPGAEAKEGETIPFRHPLAENGFITTFDPSVKTIYDNFQRSLRIYGIFQFAMLN